MMGKLGETANIETLFSGGRGCNISLAMEYTSIASACHPRFNIFYT
jgi:hypothetical protein